MDRDEGSGCVTGCVARTAIGFDRYLATLAEEWLGVEAASVLPGDPQPLGLFSDT